MKKLILAGLLALSPIANADTIDKNMLVCNNSFNLDKAYSDLMKGQQMVLDELIDKGHCAFLNEDVRDVEIEQFGAVIKARFKVNGQIHTVYYSAAELLMSRQKNK